MLKSNKMRVLKFIVGFCCLLLLALSTLPVFATGDVSTAIKTLGQLHKPRLKM